MKGHPESTSDPAFGRWLAWLETRSDEALSFSEIRRGVQALSSDYVSRRIETSGSGKALSGRAKRAAFASFYSPVHFLIARQIICALGVPSPKIRQVQDLGCGLGVASAAWALASARRPAVWACDKSAWSVEEAKKSYRAFGVRARVDRRPIAGIPAPRNGQALVAAYSVNELPSEERDALLNRCLEAHRSSGVLIIEPIAIRPLKWWSSWQRAFVRLGGRADEWQLQLQLPDSVQRIDRAAGWDHRESKARSLWLPHSNP